MILTLHHCLKEVMPVFLALLAFDLAVNLVWLFPLPEVSLVSILSADKPKRGGRKKG